MKTTSAWVVVVLFVAGSLIAALGGNAPSAPAESADSLRDAILEHEKKELDCLKTGNMDLFASLIADEAVFVNPRGQAGKAQVVKNTSEVHLEEYTIEDVRFVPVSPESGLISYELTQKGTSHGRSFSSRVFASALWVKRGNQWVCLFSQETAARPPVPAQ